MTPSETINLVIHKAKEAPERYRNSAKAAALSWAAFELWNDEYASWKAAADTLGINSRAAECAWERRTAYSELSSVLSKAW